MSKTRTVPRVRWSKALVFFFPLPDLEEEWLSLSMLSPAHYIPRGQVEGVGPATWHLPPIRKCIIHSTGLCAHSLHGQHTSLFRHETLQRVKLRWDHDTRLNNSPSPEVQHKERWNRYWTRNKLQPSLIVLSIPPLYNLSTEDFRIKKISANTKASRFFFFKQLSRNNKHEKKNRNKTDNYKI